MAAKRRESLVVSESSSGMSESNCNKMLGNTKTSAVVGNSSKANAARVPVASRFSTPSSGRNAFLTPLNRLSNGTPLSAAATIGASASPPCASFERHGTCRFGENCIFSHSLNSQHCVRAEKHVPKHGDSRGSNRKSAKDRCAMGKENEEKYGTEIGARRNSRARTIAADNPRIPLGSSAQGLLSVSGGTHAAFPTPPPAAPGVDTLPTTLRRTSRASQSDMQKAALVDCVEKGTEAPPVAVSEAESLPRAKQAPESLRSNITREKYRVRPNTTLEILESPDHFSLGYDRVLQPNEIFEVVETKLEYQARMDGGEQIWLALLLTPEEAGEEAESEAKGKTQLCSTDSGADAHASKSTGESRCIVGWAYCYDRNRGAVLCEKYIDRPWVHVAQSTGRRGIGVGWAHCAVLDEATGCVVTLGRGRYGRLGHGAESDERFAAEVGIANVDGNGSNGGGGAEAGLDAGVGAHVQAQTQTEMKTQNHGSTDDVAHSGTSNILSLSTSMLSSSRTRICAVATGYAHTILLSESSMQVYSFGHGLHGRLGHGDEVSQLRPRQIRWFMRPTPKMRKGAVLCQRRSFADEQVVQVAAGRAHSLLVTATGELMSFGCGADGQLGHGELGCFPERDEYTPKSVRRLQSRRVVTISAGKAHSLCVTETGELWSFGNGSDGALGHKRVEKHGAHSQAYATEFSYSHALPKMVLGLVAQQPIAVIAAGYKHSLLVCRQGALYSFGCGEDGRLGHGDTQNYQTPQRVKAMDRIAVADAAAGDRHSLVLSADGAVYSFGCGSRGQLGHGDREHRLIPERVLALRAYLCTSVAAAEVHSIVSTHADGTFVLGALEQAVNGVSLSWPSSERPHHLLPRSLSLSREQVAAARAAADDEARRQLEEAKGFDSHALAWFWESIIRSDGTKVKGGAASDDTVRKDEEQLHKRVAEMAKQAAEEDRVTGAREKGETSAPAAYADEGQAEIVFV